MKETLALLPAYGRAFPTLSEAAESWHKGEDFLILPNGPYCSRRDDLSAYRVVIYPNTRSTTFLEVNTHAQNSLPS